MEHSFDYGDCFSFCSYVPEGPSHIPVLWVILHFLIVDPYNSVWYIFRDHEITNAKRTKRMQPNKLSGNPRNRQSEISECNARVSSRDENARMILFWKHVILRLSIHNKMKFASSMMIPIEVYSSRLNFLVVFETGKWIGFHVDDFASTIANIIANGTLASTISRDDEYLKIRSKLVSANQTFPH